MTKFVHLTDFHIFPERQLLMGLDTHARMPRVLQSVETHHADAGA